MLVVLHCKDKPGHLQTRIDTREAHVEYIKSDSRLVMAGPLLDEHGEMCGSLLVLEMESLADAEAFAANDPYAKAGLFDEVRINAWNKAIG